MKSFLFPVAAGTLALGFALAPVPASATISRAVCMNAWNQCQATGSPTACAVVATCEDQGVTPWLDFWSPMRES